MRGAKRQKLLTNGIIESAPGASNRACFEGILWILQTGAAWRFLPSEFPSPTTWSCGAECNDYTTIRSYLHGVEHFSRYSHRSPDQLCPEDIRQYQAMLFTKLKFSPEHRKATIGCLTLGGDGAPRYRRR